MTGNSNPTGKEFGENDELPNFTWEGIVFLIIMALYYYLLTGMGVWKLIVSILYE